MYLAADTYPTPPLVGVNVTTRIAIKHLLMFCTEVEDVSLPLCCLFQDGGASMVSVVCI